MCSLLEGWNSGIKPWALEWKAGRGGWTGWKGSEMAALEELECQSGRIWIHLVGTKQGLGYWKQGAGWSLVVEEQRRRPTLEASRSAAGSERDAEPESPSCEVSSIGPARKPECPWVMVRAEPLGETEVFQLQEHRVSRGRVREISRMYFMNFWSLVSPTYHLLSGHQHQSSTLCFEVERSHLYMCFEGWILKNDPMHTCTHILTLSHCFA